MLNMNFQTSSMNPNGLSFSSSVQEGVFGNLKQQIETILSIENMAQTVVLPSYMNEDGFISVQTLIYLFQLNVSGVTVQDVLNAVRDSDKVVVDTEMCTIRPNINAERKTIILRDLDADVTEEEIRSIFEGMDCIESVKPPIGTNWFITMDSEEHALIALQSLQSKKFRDQSIHARIKNESRIMTINRLIAAEAPEMDASMYYGSFNPNSASVFSSASMTSTPSIEFDHVSKNPKRRTKKHNDRRNRSTSKPIPLPQLSSNNTFPPLVFTGAQNVGYTGSYIHYSPEEIQDIVKNVNDLSLPVVPAEDMSAVLCQEPNSELAQKQRTYSIDQSMEAGMPRTYSVDSVDYTTMLMGDMDEEVKTEARKKRKEYKPKKLDYSKIMNKKVGISVEEKKDHRRKGKNSSK